jgi:hypothetical protein
MLGVSKFLVDAKTMREMEPCLLLMQRLHESKEMGLNGVYKKALAYQGFMPSYTIWSMHGEVGVNVPQKNNVVVAMTDVALHEAVKTEFQRNNKINYKIIKYEKHITTG